MSTVRQRMLKQLFKKVQKILISIEIVHFFVFTLQSTQNGEHIKNSKKNSENQIF